jgi:uncharacterized phage infection (PIP) family protein YhgE
MGPRGVPVRPSTSRRTSTHPYSSPLRNLAKRARGSQRPLTPIFGSNQMDEDLTSGSNKGSLTDAVNSLAELVKDSHSTIKKLSEDFLSLSRKVNNHEDKFSEVDDSIFSINSSIHELKSENEFLKKELNKLNLVLFGFEESSEVEESLLREIVQLFGTLSTELINIDCVYRIGISKPHLLRPIKIKFLSMSHRNEILSNRSKLPAHLTLKEDLPFEMRRNHAILHQKKADALNSGVSENAIKIDFKRNSIKIQNATFIVRNGTLNLEQHFLGGISRSGQRK